ncbi:hypothetical protein BGZ98_003201 [Dissophora globulifera]|nr:hypothetical protein BGZ98_003201 [Dissophora globulifera]
MDIPQDEDINPQVNLALDLMRRLPPQNAEENLASLITLLPELTEEFLNSVDQPLKVQTCAKTGKEYLLCEYNRDGNSYSYPSSKLRKLELIANEALDTYRELYFEGGVSSVYFWDLEVDFAESRSTRPEIQRDRWRCLRGA